MYIFDIDGTLLNTIDAISYHLNQTFKSYGLREVPTDKVREFVGNGPRVLIEKSLDYARFAGEDELREEIYNTYNKAYDDNPLYLTKPFEGIKQELDTIKSRGEIITAFSNKPDSTSNMVLKEIFGKDYFDYILGYREDYERKPSPEGIMIIANHFDVPFSQILYFGDSEVDMKCGKNASIFTIGCSWGFRDRGVLESQNPDTIIDSPYQISSVQML